MFSVKLVARPDARMVEVPLEIEAELPREFDGAALLASSGLPRKVKLKAQKDALKLSTAYRADQLLADIVKTALRGTAQDVQRVQDAARSFVRTVRERRQDGATLIVTSNGRGKIDIADKVPSRPPPAPQARVVQPAPEPARVAGQPTLADRLGALEKRLSELESGFARIAERPAAEDRLAQLEERLAAIQAHNDLAGPLMEGGPRGPGAVAVGRGAAAPRRATAVDAFAEGLRDELRVRITEQLGTSRRSTEICDRAAALSAEAELTLGAPRDGTSQRLRATAAATAARQHALERIAEEIDMYQAADLPVAAQLVGRLEDGPAQFDTPDPAQPLQTQAEALVRAARGPLAEERRAWLARAAALCGWTLIEPRPGELVRDELAQALDAGGDHIVAVASPGLRAHDGSVLVRARVLVGAPRSEPPPQMATLPPPVGADAEVVADAEVAPDARHPHRADSGASSDARAHGGDLSATGAAETAASAGGARPAVGVDQGSGEGSALPSQAGLAAETEVSADPDWAKVARGPEAFASEAPVPGPAGTPVTPDALAGAHAALAPEAGARAEPEARLPWSATPAAADETPALPGSADPAVPWPGAALRKAAPDAPLAANAGSPSPADDLDVQEVSDDDVEEITAEEVEELIGPSEGEQAAAGQQQGSAAVKPDA